jgi:hypothetical protein
VLNPWNQGIISGKEKLALGEITDKLYLEIKKNIHNLFLWMSGIIYFCLLTWVGYSIISFSKK